MTQPFPAMPRQQELLRYLHGYQLKHPQGRPSLQVMSKALGLTSRSSTMRLLRGLQERGYLRREPGGAITILQPPAIPKIAGEPLQFIPVSSLPHTSGASHV